MQVVSILLFFLLHYTLGQTGVDKNLGTTAGGESISAIINNIFTKPVDGQTANNRGPDQGSVNLQPGAVSPGTGSEACTCVSYFLCMNNTIITDGYGVIDIRLDNGDCDYLSVCCGQDKILPEPVTPPPKVEKPKGCGSRNPDGVGFRITGAKDHEAQFGEFPWMVALLREEPIEGKAQNLLVYQCGASLIHPRVVLTAAHCVPDTKKQYKIRAGEWDTQTKSELYPFQDRDVQKVITHPKYYAGALFYDVAVLILESPLEITENVDIICLPKQDLVVENSRCYASGWGKDVFGKEGKYQVILKKIDLPIVKNDLCQTQLRQTRLGKHFILDPTFICAGGEEGKDTCKGDGGSPLICPIPGHPGRWFQAGIVAWGIGCAEKDIPGVYANVAKFADWIDEQLAFNEISNSLYKYD